MLLKVVQSSNKTTHSVQDTTNLRGDKATKHKSSTAVTTAAVNSVPVEKTVFMQCQYTSYARTGTWYLHLVFQGQCEDWLAQCQYVRIGTLCKNWYCRGCPARHLVLLGQCEDWLVQCQYVRIGTVVAALPGTWCYRSV